MTDQTTDRAVRYGAWVLRWRWPILLASLVAVVVAASGGRLLGFSNDYRVFFGEDNPQLVAYEALQNVYTKADNILFVLAPEGGEVFDADVLTAVETLTAESWKIPYALRVDAITNWQHTESRGDDLIVENLVEDAGSLDAAAIERAREIALAEPLIKNRLIADDARVTAVNVTLQFPELSPLEHTEAVAYARELAASLEDTHPGIDTYLTGTVLLSNAFSEEAQRDMTTLVPIMYLAIIVVMIGLLRSVSGTVGTLVVIGGSVASAMGLAGWAGISLTPPSASAPTMIMTLAVADSVHVLVTMLQEMRRGLDKRAAIIESLRVNLQPVFLTSLTTAIGFLSMNFSDAPPFHDLGNITAVGVAFAFVFSVLTLPALMSVLPVRVRMDEPGRVARRPIDRLADWVVAQRTPLLGASAATILVVGALVPLNELNDDFVDYFDERVEFRTATDFTTENLTGIYQIEYSISSGESDGIADPEYLAKLDDFADWYEAQPGVVHVSSFSQVMRRLNKSMNYDDPAYYVVPAERDLAAQYLLLYELSLPYGLDLNNQINVDKSATRFTVTTDNLTSLEIRELAEAGRMWLSSNAPEPMHASAASTALMFSYVSERNIKGMLLGTVLAFFLVSAVLVVALRSAKFGALSLIPNLVPAVLAFGVWGLFVGRVNIGLSVVVAMTIGIVVDDTVHFLSKYLRARREQGLGSEDAVRYAFSSVGVALVFTSAILATGFAVLSYSAFDLNAGMGKLTAVTIVVALVADFLFLPPLLMRLERRSEADVSTAAELSLGPAPLAGGAGAD